MIIHLSEKEATKLLLLVRHYANLLQSGLPAKKETIDFYEDLYDNLGVQIESHKRQSDDAEKALKDCLSSIYGKDAEDLHPEIFGGAS